jgi:predicted transcriptional regulator
MLSAKESVKRILDRLPDNASLAEIQYRIYVLDQIERGTRDLDEGRYLTQEEMRKEVEGWIAKYAGRD